MEEQLGQTQQIGLTENLKQEGFGNQKAMYETSNQQYGSAWAHEKIRPQTLNIKTAIVPTYQELIDAAKDFKKTQRLIKSKILKQQYQPSEQFNNTNSSSSNKGIKSTIKEFPVKQGQYKYPPHGLKIGSLIYKTANMTYGDIAPSDFQIPYMYAPCNNTFTKGFNGGNSRFNGLNTAKTISQVHNTLNEF